jgi:hypothetical protein
MTSTYQAISSQTVSGTSTTSITFSSIPQTYTDLRIVVNTGYSFTDTLMFLELNGSSSSIYSGNDLNGTGSAVNTGNFNNGTYFSNAGWYPYPSDATIPGLATYDINNYSDTNQFKSVLMRLNQANTLTSGRIGLFRSTSAVTSLRFFFGAYGSPYFTAGSTFTLYGIKAA